MLTGRARLRGSFRPHLPWTEEACPPPATTDPREAPYSVAEEGALRGDGASAERPRGRWEGVRVAPGAGGGGAEARGTEEGARGGRRGKGACGDEAPSGLDGGFRGAAQAAPPVTRGAGRAGAGALPAPQLGGCGARVEAGQTRRWRREVCAWGGTRTRVTQGAGRKRRGGGRRRATRERATRGRLGNRRRTMRETAGRGERTLGRRCESAASGAGRDGRAMGRGCRAAAGGSGRGRGPVAGGAPRRPAGARAPTGAPRMVA